MLTRTSVCSPSSRLTTTGVPVTGRSTQKVPLGGAFLIPTRSRQRWIASGPSGSHVPPTIFSTTCPSGVLSENPPPPPTVPSAFRGPPVQPPCPRSVTVYVPATGEAVANAGVASPTAPPAAVSVARTSLRVGTRI